jgi:hypothetical protein
MDITVHQSDQRRSPGHLSRQGPPALRWALFEAASPPLAPAAPTATTTARRRSDWAQIARACRSRASCSNAATTRCANSARRRCNPREVVMRAQPSLIPMRRGRRLPCSCRHARVDGPDRPSGRNAYPSGITPSTIMSPARSHSGSRTEIRLGARAHTTRTASRAHAPPGPVRPLHPMIADAALDARSLHR